MTTDRTNSEIVLLVFSLKKEVSEVAAEKIAAHLQDAGYRRESRKGNLPENSWFGDLHFAKTADLRDVLAIEGAKLTSAFNKIAGDAEAVDSVLIVSSRHIWWNKWGGSENANWSGDGDREHDLSRHFCDPQPRRVTVPKD